MDRVVLGRTGLEVGVAGLGSGGASRLGMARGLSTAESIALVHQALDLGIDFLDTAPTYGTEDLVGAALLGKRNKIVLSTKCRANKPGTHLDSTDLIDGDALIESVENSLRALRTDWIDILLLHGVRPHQYEHSVDVLLPTLVRLREQGKVRFFGITEGFGVDADHETLLSATAHGGWDVLMGGFNLLNPSAAQTVLPAATSGNLPFLCMYAVRGALTNWDRLRSALNRMESEGLNWRQTFEHLKSLAERANLALPELAYRFCRHTTGVSVVLFGTGSADHLKQNIGWINAPRLDPQISEWIKTTFDAVRRETGDL